jgi:hypothetical protein
MREKKLRAASPDPLAHRDHAAEMVGLIDLHHVAGDVFGFVAAVEFLQREGVVDGGSLVDGENLESRAVFAGVGKNDRGHGGFFSEND